MNDRHAAERTHVPMPFRASTRIAYAVAVASAVVASGLVELSLLLHLSYNVTGIFVGAVVASTCFSGTGPGLATIGVLLVLIGRLLLPAVPTAASWLHLAVFVFFSAALSRFVGMRRRVFAKLVIELQQYRSIFYWAPMGIVLLGRNRVVQFLNPAFEKLYGWSLEELRGRPLPIPESELEDWDKLEDTLNEGGSFVNHPAKRVRKDGVEIHVLISGTSVADDDGSSGGLVGLAIEAGPRPEVLLERKRLECLVNNSSDFICITDLDHRVRFLNNTGKDMVGMREGESELMMPLLSLFQEEDHATITGTMIPLTLDGFPLDRPLYLKNLRTGDLVPVQGPIRTMTDARTGTVSYLAYVLQNRSDLNRAEASRVRAEKAFSTLLKAAPIAIALVNTQGQPFDSNEKFQQLFGYSAEEVKQGPFSKFVHPEDLPRGRQVFLELASGKTDSYQVNKRLCHKNGNQFWAKMTVSLVRGDSGEPSYCISMVEPIGPAASSVDLPQQPIRMVG
jgi:PAS domain S-box-containing protein